MRQRRRFDGKVFAAAALVAGAALASIAGAASPAAAQDYTAWYDDAPPAEPSPAARRRIPHRPKIARATAPRRASKFSDATTAPAASAAAPVPVPKLPLFAVVSIADQHVSIYNHEGLVVSSPVSTGVPGHSTPRGIFTIIGRERYHNSNIYSGAPMPFMQRITWSGIAMHLGVVPGHPASHGCIRLPAGFAAKLWGMTKIGERVVISQQDVFPTEFSHRLLPTPKMRAPEAGPPADKPPPAPGAESALVSAQPPLVNPRQYAEQLRNKAVADATAAAKALKERAAEVAALQQESARAGMELRAAEARHAQAQAKSESADKAFERASAAVESAKQREVVVAAADIKTAEAGISAAKPAGPSKAYDRAVALKDAAATAKASAAAALTEAGAKLDAARAAASAKSAQLTDAMRRQDEAKAAADAAAAARKEAERRMSPISVLVSKKDGKIYVRQGLAVLFDAPVTVRDPDTPLGTHLYIATAPGSDGASLKWTALSPPSPPVPEPAPQPRIKVGAAQADIPVLGRREPSGAGEALERVDIAQDVRDKIAERLWTGGSIIISDQPPSVETGAEGTDLTVKLR